MTRSLPAIVLLLLALSSCAPSGPDPGYAEATGPFARSATRSSPVPPASCPKPGPSLPCARGGSSTGSPALFNAPSQGIYQPPVIPAASPPAPPAEPSVPPLGSPVFGPTGVLGTIINHAGNNAVVAPVGGGAPGLMVPNGNGTATIFVPGSVPTVVATPPVP